MVKLLFWVGVIFLIHSILKRWKREHFVLRVEGGQARVVKGRVPGELLGNLRDIVARGPAREARLSITVTGDVAHVDARGDWSEAQLQQLRNVVGLVSPARLRNP